MDTRGLDKGGGRVTDGCLLFFGYKCANTGELSFCLFPFGVWAWIAGGQYEIFSKPTIRKKAKSFLRALRALLRGGATPSLLEGGLYPPPSRSSKPPPQTQDKLHGPFFLLLLCCPIGFTNPPSGARVNCEFNDLWGRGFCSTICVFK